MSNNVPYAFVPGTKAKADEINANFIDILDKIDTKHSEMLLRCAELSEADNSVRAELVEITDTINESKADKSELDGCWTYSYMPIALTNISPGGTHTYDMSDYLPQDENLYEILICPYLLNSGNVNCMDLHLKTDFLTENARFFGYGYSASLCFYEGMSTILVGAGRFIKIWESMGSSGDTKYSLEILAYRKVR